MNKRLRLKWRSRRKQIVSMMLCLLLMMTVSGCSGAVISDESRFGQTEITEAGNAAMGRYMEEKSKVEGQFCAPRAFARLTDGRLMILDNISCSLVSEDGGVTWHTKKVEGFDNLTRDMYFMDMKAAPDGTIAILTSPYPEDTFHPEVLLFSPEGEKISIDVTVEEADNYMRTLWFAPDGRLFGIAGGDGIYEINVEEGSCRLYLNVKALSYPEALYIQGKYMIIKSNFGGLYIYDMEAEEYLDDEVLWNFMEKYYAGTEEYLILPEEEGSLYIAGKEGLHRHVIGGSAMEQVIDGSLSSFGDSSVDMINIQPSGEDGFVVLLSSGELCTYTYHPEIPTVPARTLRAYSLEENSALRQAIVVFQRENPDVYVEYEIGMDGKGAATRDDAIKKLNTEIMSGGGPDLVVLDGMPMDSYLEKGMLLDISPYLANMWEGPLWPNVVESFTVDDKIYMIPATIAVPVLGAKEEYLKDIFNLSDLAERIEKLRREHPGEEIMELISEEVALHRFMAVSEPFWLSKDGSIDRELLADYLMQTKRIYDASLESLPEEAVERNASFEKTRIEVGATDYLSIRTLAPWYANGKLLVASGNLYDVGSFACLCSVKGERGMDDLT